MIVHPLRRLNFFKPFFRGKFFSIQSQNIPPKSQVCTTSVFSIPVTTLSREFTLHYLDQMLQSLERLQIEYLKGTMTSATSSDLRSLYVDSNGIQTDNCLFHIFQSIRTRIAVELAKCGRSL